MQLLGSPLPLCCCNLFIATFSICLGDKRVTRSLPVCAARAVSWPCWPTGTAKQEVESLFEILTSCRVPRFLNASNPTTHLTLPYTPLHHHHHHSYLATPHQTKQGENTDCTWIKDWVAGKDTHRTTCQCWVCPVVNTCVSLGSGRKEHRTRHNRATAAPLGRETYHTTVT